MHSLSRSAASIVIGLGLVLSAYGQEQEQEQHIVVDDDQVTVEKLESREYKKDSKVDDQEIVIKTEGNRWIIRMDGEDLAIDELIERALKENPELQFAEADIARAVSNLQRVRADVVRDITRLHRDLIRTQRELAEKRHELDVEHDQDGDDDSTIEFEFGDEVADLKTLLHEISLSVGSGLSDAFENIDVDFRGMVPNAPRAPFGWNVSGATAERPKFTEAQEATLGLSLSILFEDVILGDVLDFIGQQFDVNFVISPEVADVKIGTIKLEDTSLRGIMLALTDSIPELVFVFRDYGILATTEGSAAKINAPAIPEDTPYIGRSPRPSPGSAPEAPKAPRAPQATRPVVVVP